MAMELGSRRAGGRLLIEVQSRRQSDVAADSLVRGVRPDADLVLDTSAPVPTNTVPNTLKGVI